MGMRLYLRSLFVLALLVCFFSLWSSAARANSLTYPKHTVDRLMVLEGAEALMRGAQADQVLPSKDGAAVQLKEGAPAGTLLLPATKLDFPFNELIPSWNGSVDNVGGFRIWMRAGTKEYTTPWLEAGTWGRLADESTTRIQVFSGGKYDVDTLLLDRPAEFVQFRIDLVRQAIQNPSPRLSLVAISYTNSMGDERLWKKFGDSRPAVSKELDRLRTTESLALPFYSQVIPRKEWIGRICAASSVNMALAHYRQKLPTQSIAEMIYDPASDAFGVWHRSVQGAAQLGVRGYIRRFRNFDDVREELSKGSVICASIRFKHGTLREPPRQYRRRGTEGHLIAIAGFAPGGYVIVNDSATKDYGRGQVWRQDDLAHAWFDKGGVAYVFTGAAN